MPEQQLPPWEWVFLTPRYWPTWLLVGLLWLASVTPYSWRVRLGGALGALLGRVMVRRRNIAATNLALCFPGLDAPARRRLLDAHFRAFGQGLLDMGVAWWGDDARLRALCQVEGMQHLEAARATGRGVILLGGHFTTMEIGARILCMHAPVPYLYSIYRRSKNRLFERMMLAARIGQRGVMFAREDVRTMISALRAGEGVCFYPDQDHGRRHSVFVPFFGVPAATVTATARFAKMTNALVLPYFQERLPGAQGYRLRVLAPLDDFPSADPTADTARLSALFEAEAGARPHEYYWIHRRFKTRPEPGENVYGGVQPHDGTP